MKEGLGVAEYDDCFGVLLLLKRVFAKANISML